MYANGAVRRIMRLPEDALLEGHYVHELMPGRREQLLDLREHVQKNLKPGNGLDVQSEGVRADGTPLVADIHATELPDGRVLLTVSDVTAQAQARRAAERRARVPAGPRVHGVRLGQRRAMGGGAAECVDPVGAGGIQRVQARR